MLAYFPSWQAASRKSGQIALRKAEADAKASDKEDREEYSFVKPDRTEDDRLGPEDSEYDFV